MSEFKNTKTFVLHSETVHLKNVVKTEGLLFKKERYALLTNQRILLFKNHTTFLEKKSPRKVYCLDDFDFSVGEKNVLFVSKNVSENRVKIIKKIFFHEVNVCLQWWNTIKQIKGQTKKDLEDESEEEDVVHNNNTLILKTLNRCQTSAVGDQNNFKFLTISTLPNKNNSCMCISNHSRVNFLNTEGNGKTYTLPLRMESLNFSIINQKDLSSEKEESKVQESSSSFINEEDLNSSQKQEKESSIKNQEFNPSSEKDLFNINKRLKEKENNEESTLNLSVYKSTNFTNVNYFPTINIITEVNPMIKVESHDIDDEYSPFSKSRKIRRNATNQGDLNNNSVESEHISEISDEDFVFPEEVQTNIHCLKSKGRTAYLSQAKGLEVLRTITETQEDNQRNKSSNVKSSLNRSNVCSSQKINSQESSERKVTFNSQNENLSSLSRKNSSIKKLKMRSSKKQISLPIMKGKHNDEYDNNKTFLIRDSGVFAASKYSTGFDSVYSQSQLHNIKSTILKPKSPAKEKFKSESLLESTIRNCYNQDFLNNLVFESSNLNDDELTSKIAEKIEFLLSLVQQKTNNNTFVFETILEKVPRLLLKSLNTLNCKLLTNKKRTALMISNDIIHIQKLIEDKFHSENELVLSKKKKFKVEMICLKAIISLRLIFIN